MILKSNGYSLGMILVTLLLISSSFQPVMGFFELTETLPEERLTDQAKSAIARAPQWMRQDLSDNLMVMESEYQDLYSDMILNPSEDRFTDEIAFCVAQLAPEILQNEIFTPGLLEENVYYIYEHDNYLDYVRLEDFGIAGVDEDYYTTAYYRVEEEGVINEYELDFEKYYWFIVHPKIEDEMADYIDPDAVGGPHADPPIGVFWRDWLFTHTEEMPETKELYPILREQMAGVDVLWKSKTNDIDNGAIGVITQWILDVLDFDAGVERPIQPVRIYKLHLGRCGEHQDITSAAARACLIPCVNTEAIGEDHVWNEFWDRRYIHWEPVNTMIDSPLTYENGWGRVFSGVINVCGDGYIWDVVERYSEGFCSVNVSVVDQDGIPVDGAKILFKKNVGYSGIWGFTNSSGQISIHYGDSVPCNARIMSDLGKYPEDTFFQITPQTEDGADYTWEAHLPYSLPKLDIHSYHPTTTDALYRFSIHFEVTEEAEWGYYQFDSGNHYSRRSLSTGWIDCFIVDSTNLQRYQASEPFIAFEPRLVADQDTVDFNIPHGGNWTAIITTKRKLQCTQFIDVDSKIQENVNGKWTDLTELSGSVCLFPSEDYMVTTTIPVELGVSLEMPSHDYSPGDACWLDAILKNPDQDLPDTLLFVILDVYGNYYFWPEWTMMPDLSWQNRTIHTGTETISILPQFTWPENTGSAEGIAFHAAFTDANLTQLIGHMDSWIFGWSE
ncbi:hypothetical protein JW979_05335 [bacterium]|nr:hypothetical protein [candidate division CSSED10-310 bacterium]